MIRRGMKSPSGNNLMDKRNLILGGILVALVAFAYIQKGPWKEWQEDQNKQENFFAVLDIDSIEKMEISQGTGTPAWLEKSGEFWKVGGTKDFYVKTAMAEKLAEAVKELAGGELEVVSENEGNKKDFGTDDKGIAVKFAQGGANYDLVIGNVGPTAASSYLSRPGDSKTYLLDFNIRTAFARSDWRDEQIFSFLPERAKKIRFQYPNREFTVEKVENEWKGVSPYDFPVTEDKITELLTVLGNLSAAKIPEQTFAGTGLEKHNIIVEVFDSISSYTIMVGDADKDGLYYAKKGSSDNIYLITKEERDALNKYIKDLK